MLDKTSLDDKKILVLFNIEFLQVLVEERKINSENIYYIADNDLEYLSAIKIFKVQSYCVNHKYDKKGNPIYDVKDLYDIIKGLNMKFDLVFSNPPYNRGMDIKILNEILSYSKEFIVIHPSTWLFDMKGKTKLYVDFKNKIANNVKSIQTFNGSSVFGIVLNSPTTITHIDMSYFGKVSVNHFNNDYIANYILDVTKYGKNWQPLVQSYFKFINAYCINHGNVWQHNITVVDYSKFHCQLASIIGNINKKSAGEDLYKDDFYTLIVKNENTNKGIRIPDLNKPGNPIPTFEFDTENERDSFVNYLKTDFVRFNLSLLKNNPAVSLGEMDLIPWLDFTEEWDDDKLFKKFDNIQRI